MGQIRPCPRPLQEYVSLMTDLMALDTESGRLIKKTRFGEDGGGGGAGSGGSSGAAGSGGAGSGGGSGSSSPVKASRRKPRSGWYYTFAHTGTNTSARVSCKISRLSPA